MNEISILEIDDNSTINWAYVIHENHHIKLDYQSYT